MLISANGGVNFYIGSAPEYRGVIGVRPGPEWELLMRAPIDVGYEMEGERSQYHFREARALIASDPIRWVAHTARKLGHVWHGRELPSNRDLYGSRGQFFRPRRAAMAHAGVVLSVWPARAARDRRNGRVLARSGVTRGF